VATVIAVVAALGAACCFALAAVVQHSAARDTGEKLLRLRLLLALARNPRWLAGVALGVLSFAIQGLALAFGPLALVQPLAATDVLFALPMIAVLHHYRLTRGDWLGAGAVAGGIALFLAVSPPSEGMRAPGLAAWAPVIVTAGVFAAVAGLVATRARGATQVIWLAAGAGITYGVLDALTKSTVDLLADNGFATLLRWEPYALLAAGTVGTLLSQSAFQAGALSVSLPVIDTLEPVSAVVVGAFVFGERLAASPGRLAAQLAGGAIAAAGIAALSRSSVAAAEATPGTASPDHPLPPHGPGLSLWGPGSGQSTR
jgi:drug/metabolite transporter (DMT)-like permease